MRQEVRQNGHPAYSAHTISASSKPSLLFAWPGGMLHLCTNYGNGLTDVRPQFTGPESQHLPACFMQLGVICLIPSCVPVDATLPEVRVGPGQLPVAGATVPEAPIDEDRESSGTDREVRPRARDTAIHPIANTLTPERSAEAQFYVRSSPTDGSHNLTAAPRRKWIGA